MKHDPFSNQSPKFKDLVPTAEQKEVERVINEGARLMLSGNLRDAHHHFELATQLAPRFYIGWLNLGIAKDALANKEAARYDSEECYRKSLALRVTVGALSNLANVIVDNDVRVEEAAELYREAAIRHRWEPAQYNGALCLLMLACKLKIPEAWREAWRWYEGRPQMKKMREHDFLWRGEALEGKTLLVRMDQGFGDFIWNMRWVRRAKQAGAQVIIMCGDNFADLARAQPYVDAVKTDREEGFGIDYVTQASSMAGYMMTGLPEAESGYLAVPRDLRQREHGTPPRIGVCWSGSVHEGYQAWRNIDRRQLLDALTLTRPDVVFVSLQMGPDAMHESEYPRLDIAAIAECKNLLDTAQLIKSCDLVITIDTVIPHLADAVGVQTWLLNRFMSCWQWGPPSDIGSREDPYDPHWYGGMVRQFRQPKPFEWNWIVEDVCHALEGWKP